MIRVSHPAVRPALALAIALSLMAGIAEAQTKVSPGWNMFSPQQDAQIGRDSAIQAETQLPILRNAAVEAYVNKIGQKLAANAGGPAFQYQFKVVNQSEINAFALPGGYIYLNRGILENATNEGEVAGVLAHEIAHVALRHGTHQASKAYGAQAGLQILGGLLSGKVGSNTAQVLNTVGGIGMNALFLKFTRELETQADVRGAQILAASGYTPADMVSFFHQLEKVDKSKKTTWLSHHPAPPDRIARIEKERLLLNEPSTPTRGTTQLARVKTELRGTSRAVTPRPVQQTASTATSTGWQRYSSSAYDVAFPSGWRVYERDGFGVTIAPQGGFGNVSGRAELINGLMVDRFSPSRASTTLTRATEELLGHVTNGSPYLRLMSGSEQSLRLDGQSAIGATLRGRNPNTGVEERVILVTRGLSNGQLMYMLFVTPERNAASQGQILNTILQSVDVR